MSGIDQIVNDTVKKALGEQALQIIVLSSQLAEAQTRISELEANEKARLEPTPSKPNGATAAKIQAGAPAG